ncbi:HTH_Tnp_Tc3_2 domain-containing protein [Trichonephila clavipes]|nr:HTH_Tnp_Tc3_2 domain-containing protein [Trichonephila clavipes]
MGGGQKTIDRTNCEGQLALTLCCERRLRCVVGSNQSETVAQIITQLNDGANRKVSNWTVQLLPYLMGFESRQPTRVPFFNARYRAKCQFRSKRAEKLECIELATSSIE